MEEFTGNNVETVHLVVRNTALLLLSCMSLDKVFKPQFCHLQNGGDSSTHLMGLRIE